MKLVEVVHDRSEMLQKLSEGPKSPTDLIDSLPLSKATVYRALDSLGSAGLVKREEDARYSLTLKGRTALKDFERHARDTGRVTRYSEELSAMPEELEQETDLLRGAEFYTREDDPVAKCRENIERCDRFRGLSSARRFEIVDQLLGTLREGGDVTLVLTEELIDAVEVGLEDELDEFLDAGGDIYSHSGEIPFALEIMEGEDWCRVSLGLLGQQDEIELLAVNDSPEAFEAAVEILEDYRKSSLPYPALEPEPTPWDRDKLKDVVDKSPDFISTSKPGDEEQVKYVNPAGRRLMGLPERGPLPDEYLRIESYHPDWALKKIQEVGHPVADEEGSWVGETAILTTEGEEIPVLQTLVNHEDGDDGFYSTVVHDISDLKARERHIEKLKDEYESIFNNVQDALFLLDVDGDDFRFIRLNPAHEDKTGLRTEEVAGKTPTEALGPELGEELEDNYRRCVEEGEPISYEETLNFPAGEKVWRTNLTPITVDGEVQKIVGSARDITKQKMYEGELEEQKERLKLLNRLTGHDIRNEMNLILAYSQELEAKAEGEKERMARNIYSIGEEVVRLMEMTRSFVKGTDTDEGSLQAVNLRDAIKSAISTKGISYEKAELRTDSIPETEVKADDMLSSVFLNLINNAVTHNDREIPEIEISAEVEGERAEVRVADNGPGITEEMREKIFEKEAKGDKSSGTGFGLYLVKTLIEKYGGDIRVEDNEPKGSIFVVELPIAEENAGTNPEA